jgi:hypothetical protein
VHRFRVRNAPAWSPFQPPSPCYASRVRKEIPIPNQSRSLLQTPQKYPRAGSQSYPSPAAEADADDSTTVYFGPKQPSGVARGNWVQTDPKKGWFTILRLYSPMPSFFDKTWQPGEIELVK